MKDLFEFIDSPDIREYNRETGFTPAEWAVLIRASRKQTMEDKREARQYLVNHYRAKGACSIYIFDSELCMVELFPELEQADGKDINFLDDSEAYNVFVLLPFQKGDIIKVGSDRCASFYGVMCCDWKCCERDWTVPMWLPLDCYNERYRDFDYVDGGYSDVLQGVVCPEEELPED